MFDTRASLAFYPDLLGLVVEARYERDERPAQREPGRHAAHSDTSLFFACADVDELYREFLCRGLTVEPPSTRHCGMRQLYVADPDNYTLSFQQAVRN